MTPSRSRSLRVLVATALAVAVSTLVPTLGVQQPAPVPPSPGSPAPQSPPPAAIAAYRAPVIALVQPAGGGTVPQDKPVVVFRFAQGEATDPLDARSFAVSVDGEDRTALFQVAAAEAWGPLADGAHALAAGAHQVTARICSARGACAAVSATVTIVPPQQAGASTAASGSRRERLIDLVLQAARRLLTP